MSRLSPLIAILLLVFVIFGATGVTASAQSIPGDIAAAAKETSSVQGEREAIAGMTPLIYKLRGFAVVLLLITLAFAAIAAAMGKQGMAISVGVGAMVLFGGFWVVTMIRGSLEGEGASEIKVVYTTSTLAGADQYKTAGSQESLVAPILRGVMEDGLSLLGSAIAPFVVIYGFYLALSFAMGAGEPNAVFSYITGSIIAFGASLIAQFYNVF